MSISRILLVEDEFLIRMTLSEALADAGFDVVEAGSGDEALFIVQASGTIDLLLTDVQLPGKLNGVALARAARECRPELPVIFVTGRPDTMHGAGNSGRDLYIAKPYLPSEICAAARKLLAN